MNSLVKKYMSTCQEGQKLNIKSYIQEVTTTNKSFFYPDDFTLRRISNLHDRSSTSINSPIGGPIVKPIGGTITPAVEANQDSNLNSLRRESITHGSQASPELSKKQTKKMLIKQ